MQSVIFNLAENSAFTENRPFISGVEVESAAPGNYR